MITQKEGEIVSRENESPGALLEQRDRITGAVVRHI